MKHARGRIQTVQKYRRKEKSIQASNETENLKIIPVKLRLTKPGSLTQNTASEAKYPRKKDKQTKSIRDKCEKRMN